MNRYLLDTNILAFISTGQMDEINPDVTMILADYNCSIAASSIAFAELIQLYRIGKIRLGKRQDINDILTTLTEDMRIEVLPFTQKHVDTLATLETIDGHNDPFDHAIISQAITDKLTLISSDRKFKYY